MDGADAGEANRDAMHCARFTGDGALVEGEGIEAELEAPAALDPAVPADVPAVQSDMLQDAAPDADALAQDRVMLLCVLVLVSVCEFRAPACC